MASPWIKLYRALREGKVSSAAGWVWQGVCRDVIFRRRRLRQREELEREDGFDARYGTDTTGLVAVDDLGLPRERAGDAILYWPSLTRTVDRVLGELAIDAAAFTFVDLGSGKGRVILQAALHPFRACVGVELSEPLHRVAERNVAVFDPPERKCRDLRVVLGDAAAFRFPDGNLVVYMFDPFGEPVMARVVANLEEALRTSPRTVIVAYLHARCAEPLDRSPFFRLVRRAERVGPRYVTVEYDYRLYSSVRSR